MKFDRNAPGGGVETICRLENGKAFLEWRFRFAEDAGSQAGRSEKGGKEANGENMAGAGRALDKIIRVTATDSEGNVAECMQLLREEEPLETILIQPCLWQGTQAPCLYDVEASVAENGRCLDRISKKLPLRVMEVDGSGQLLLNGQPLTPRAVRYSLPAPSGTMWQRLVLEDFRWLRKLGANSVCVEEREFTEFPECFKFLLQLCDRLGFLLFAMRQGLPYLICIWDKEIRWQYKEPVPSFRGTAESFFPKGGPCPSSSYYRYMAGWGREPFVYIVPESVKRLKSGNYTVNCYSNCGRVALYADGFLFELKKGEGEFIFQEVPAKSPCVRLSAEGEGCSAALSVHKSFIGRPQGRNIFSFVDNAARFR